MLVPFEAIYIYIVYKHLEGICSIGLTSIPKWWRPFSTHFLRLKESGIHLLADVEPTCSCSLWLLSTRCRKRTVIGICNLPRWFEKFVMGLLRLWQYPHKAAALVEHLATSLVAFWPTASVVSARCMICDLACLPIPTYISILGGSKPLPPCFGLCCKSTSCLIPRTEQEKFNGSMTTR